VHENCHLSYLAESFVLKCLIRLLSGGLGIQKAAVNIRLLGNMTALFCAKNQKLNLITF